MTADSLLAENLTRASLMRLAGEVYFARGEDYFEDDRVRNLREVNGRVTAKVAGTHKYTVALWVSEGSLDHFCSCPLGGGGEFCKHCVAVGLAWLLERKSKKDVRKKGRRKSGLTGKDVRRWLLKQGKENLADWLIEAMNGNDRLYNRLLLQAANETGNGVDIASYEEVISRALNPGDFIDYNDMYDYTRGVEEMLRSLAQLTKKGDPSALMELCEYALDQAKDAMRYLAHPGSFPYDLMRDLRKMHLAACRKASPDPAGLAEKIFNWELEDQWDVFDDLSESYSKVLGRTGLDAYRKLVQAEWKKVKPLAPGEEDQERYGRHYRITGMMEKIAGAGGDLEALVAVKERDLSRDYNFLNIAELYAKAGRHEKAMEWAERGLRAFPDGHNAALQDLLADEYHRCKRHDDAISLIWTRFERHPELENYKDLKRHTGRIKRWPQWRIRALKHLQKKVRKQPKSAFGAGWAYSSWSECGTLVKIFLWEKDVEAAWQAAMKGDCNRELWFRLAAAREETHPDDAVKVYRNHLDSIINLKNNEAYREAVGILRKVQKLMAKLGRNTEFRNYLAEVRAAHKRKRNFIALVDKIK